MSEHEDVEPEPIKLSVQLPPDVKDAPADFISVWHTPAMFVFDFVAVKRPPQAELVDGEPTGRAVLDAEVTCRVRVPPEQVLPIARALEGQMNKWLREKGMSEPPEAWFPPDSP